MMMMKKNTTLAAVILVALSALLWLGCAGPVDTADAAESVDLFNGRDLQGWSAFLADPGVPMEDVWSVRDGMLVCKGEPLGYLYSNQDYTDFNLVVEWRWAPETKPGNSGVLMRINGEPKPIPRSIEAQLMHENAGDVYAFHGMRLTGAEDRLRGGENHELLGDFVGVSKSEFAENPPGEWNIYDITIDGPQLTVFVNGRKVNEAWDCDIVPGPIGLQSEGGEIHFRTVRLTPLR
jgi:hypothetical protein